MKILALGDLHGKFPNKLKKKAKDVDLILCVGDFGSADLMRKRAFENIERKRQGLQEIKYSPVQEKKAFMDIYNSTMKLVCYLSKFAPVFTIFGNVEISNYETRKYSKEIGLHLPYLYDNLNSIRRVRIINNVVANFNGIRIGGLEYFVDTNWVRRFMPSDLKKMARAKKETEKAKKVLKKFNSLDILVCHQPPYGILDKVNATFAPKNWRGKHAGSKIILDYIKREKPKYVFCGHIHEGKGMKKIGETEIYNLGLMGYKLIEIN